MNRDNLRTILECKTGYFALETYSTWSNTISSGENRYLVLICIPDIVWDIRNNTTYDFLTLKEYDTILDQEIDFNIFLSDDYPPFQRGKKFFKDTVKCVPLYFENYTTRDLINGNFKTIYELNTYLESRKNKQNEI